MKLITRPIELRLGLILISWLIAIGIGALILGTPVQLQADYGMQFGDDADLLCEIHAPLEAPVALAWEELA